MRNQNNKILTSSSDNTIRLWDNNGNFIRNYLGDIGEGDYGHSFAIDFDIKERFVVSGFRRYKSPKVITNL